MLNGSCSILGYDKDPANSSRYVVNESEAALVRQIFEMYLELGSTYATAAKLNELGVPRKASTLRRTHWTFSAVLLILTNFAYIGKREVNKKRKSENSDNLKPWQQYQIVDAAWPAIVSQETFDGVQIGLKQAYERDRKRRENEKNRIFLLSGLLKCKECGSSFVGQTAHGKKRAHRYYTHKATPGRPISCAINRIPADELEETIVTHLTEIVHRSGHFDEVERNIRTSLAVTSRDLQSRRKDLDHQILKLEKGLDALIQLQIEMPQGSSSAELLREKLEVMASEKKRLVAEREEVVEETSRDRTSREAREILENKMVAFRKGYSKGSPIYRRRMIRQILEVMNFTPEYLEVRYVIHSNVLFFDQKKSKASEVLSGAESPSLKKFKKTSLKPAGRFEVFCSHSEGTGGRDRDRTCDLEHAIVKLSQFSKNSTPFARKKKKPRQTAIKRGRRGLRRNVGWEAAAPRPPKGVAAYDFIVWMGFR